MLLQPQSNKQDNGMVLLKKKKKKAGGKMGAVFCPEEEKNLLSNGILSKG